MLGNLVNLGNLGNLRNLGTVGTTWEPWNRWEPLGTLGALTKPWKPWEPLGTLREPWEPRECWEPLLGNLYLGTLTWEPLLGNLGGMGFGAAPVCSETFTMAEDPKVSAVGEKERRRETSTGPKEKRRAYSLRSDDDPFIWGEKENNAQTKVRLRQQQTLPGARVKKLVHHVTLLLLVALWNKRKLENWWLHGKAHGFSCRFGFGCFCENSLQNNKTNRISFYFPALVSKKGGWSVVRVSVLRVTRRKWEEPANHDGTEPLPWGQKEERRGDKHRNQRRQNKGDKHPNPSRNHEEPANHDGTEPRREKKGDKHWNPSRNQEEPANHDGTEPPFLRKKRSEKKGDKHQNQRREKKGDKHRNPSRNQRKQQITMEQNPFSEEKKKREEETSTPQREPGGASKSWGNKGRFK